MEFCSQKISHRNSQSPEAPFGRPWFVPTATRKSTPEIRRRASFSGDKPKEKI